MWLLQWQEIKAAPNGQPIKINKKLLFENLEEASSYMVINNIRECSWIFVPKYSKLIPS